jgi:hypothetical protein
LANAGAAVAFTREGNRTMTPYQRVHRSIDENAELVISIGIDSLPPHACKLFYYSSSEAGKDICRLLAQAITSINGEKGMASYGGHATVLLQQTPCPAVLVSPCSILDPDTSLVSVQYLSYALYRGIVHYFLKQSKTSQILLTLKNPPVCPEAFALFDNYLSLPVGKTGRIICQGLETGTHRVQIFCGNKELLSSTFTIDNKKRLHKYSL